MANVKNLQIDGNDLFDVIYPIGTVYNTTESTFDPNISFYGTWERIKGKVLVGVDESDTDFASSKKTGGKKSISLGVTNLPARTIVSTQNTTGASKYISGIKWGAATIANNDFVASTLFDLVQNNWGGLGLRKSNISSPTILYSLYVEENRLRKDWRCA